MMLIKKKPRALPDISKLSAADKDRLILKLYARFRAEEAKLKLPESERWSIERVRRPFLAGEANKTPSTKPELDRE